MEWSDSGLSAQQRSDVSCSSTAAILDGSGRRGCGGGSFCGSVRLLSLAGLAPVVDHDANTHKRAQQKPASDDAADGGSSRGS